MPRMGAPRSPAAAATCTLASSGRGVLQGAGGSGGLLSASPCVGLTSHTCFTRRMFAKPNLRSFLSENLGLLVLEAARSSAPDQRERRPCRRRQAGPARGPPPWGGRKRQAGRARAPRPRHRRLREPLCQCPRAAPASRSAEAPCPAPVLPGGHVRTTNVAAESHSCVLISAHLHLKHRLPQIPL